MKLDHDTREFIKRESWPKVNNSDLPLSERVRAATQILKCWYARSRESAKINGWLKEHPGFKEYAAAILGSSPDNFPKEIKARLVKRYGIKRGVIPEGDSYYPAPERR